MVGITGRRGIATPEQSMPFMGIAGWENPQISCQGGLGLAVYLIKARID